MKLPGECVYRVRYVLNREGWASAPDSRRKRQRRSLTRLVLSKLA